MFKEKKFELWNTKLFGFLSRTYTSRLAYGIVIGSAVFYLSVLFIGAGLGAVTYIVVLINSDGAQILNEALYLAISCVILIWLQSSSTDWFVPEKKVRSGAFTVGDVVHVVFNLAVFALWVYISVQMLPDA